jgi:hypothetical protein
MEIGMQTSMWTEMPVLTYNYKIGRRVWAETRNQRGAAGVTAADGDWSAKAASKCSSTAGAILVTLHEMEGLLSAQGAEARTADTSTDSSASEA